MGVEDSPRALEGSLFFDEVEESTDLSGVTLLLVAGLPGAGGGFSVLTGADAGLGEWYLNTVAVAVAEELLQEAVWGEGAPPWMEFRGEW